MRAIVKRIAHQALQRSGYRLVPIDREYMQAYTVHRDGRLERIKERGEGVHHHGLVLTAASTASLHDRKFDAALRAGVAQDPQAEIESIRFRIYNFISYLDYARHLPGDILQIGVSWGKFIGTALRYFEDLDKPIYLLDPFELAPGSNDPGGHVYCHDHQAMLRGLDGYAHKVTPIIGFAPEALAQVPSEQFCFVHMNAALPDVELASFDALYDQVVPGGIILIDYFAWQGSNGTEDRYMRRAEARGARFVSLLSGQGLLIKPAV